MKRKLVTTVISLLLCLGVVGSGFAAWVISRTTEDTAEGNFTVETVQDAVLNFDAAITNGDVHFGKPSAEAISSYQWAESAAQVKWFNDDGATVEDLTATVTLTLTDVDKWLDGYTYTLASERVPLRALIKSFNQAVDGRGGGSDEMVTGRAYGNREAIEGAVKAL
jgi:hypothetical protein